MTPVPCGSCRRIHLPPACPPPLERRRRWLSLTPAADAWLDGISHGDRSATVSRLIEREMTR